MERAMENKTLRPTAQHFFLNVAQALKKRSTCVRRQVGCVLVDWNNHIVATGYNGVPREWTHCILVPCPGARHPSGKGLNLCFAVHAEQNALIQCADVEKLKAAYCTVTPCIHCMKMLMNTSTQHIYADEIYKHKIALLMWLKAGRSIFIRMCDEENNTYRQLREEEVSSYTEGEGLESDEEALDKAEEK